MNENIISLRQDFASGRRFTLFAGAGINASKQVNLLWNELIKEACEYSFRLIGNNLNLTKEDIDLMMSVLGIRDWKIPQSQLVENESVKREFLYRIMELKDYASTHFPVEIQVSIIKSLLGDFYIPFLQDYLYKECNRDIIIKFFETYKLKNKNLDLPKELYTLFVVARMILLNPQIESVITYNYDNFLSVAICYLLKNAKDFFSAEEIEFLRLRYRVSKLNFEGICPAVDVGDKFKVDQYKDWRAVPIYHVHGYIPAPYQFQNIEDSSIILSMDEYCSEITDNSSWRINVQEKAIQTTHCLFVGLSLTDLTTKRLMHLAEHHGHNHNFYVLDAHGDISSESDELRQLRNVMRKIKNGYLTSLGMSVIDCDKGFQYLFTEIAKIRDNYFSKGDTYEKA